MHRRMIVSTRCRRCQDDSYLYKLKLALYRAHAFASAAGESLLWGQEENGYNGDDAEFFPASLYTPEHEVKVVFIPTEILKAAASLVNKSGATAIFGAKPPNDWLQIANLVSQGKHAEDYAYALCTVGAAAIVDEVTCSMPAMTCYGFLFGGEVPNGALAAGLDECGLAWTRYKPVEQKNAIASDPDTADVDEGGQHGENRPNVQPPCPTVPAPPGLEQIATVATEIDAQMGAYVEGSVLHSSVVHSEHGDHVHDNRTASGDVGERTARFRFPKTSEVKEYLFNNDPENLVSAEAMRNTGVGVADLSPEQSKAFDEAVAALKKHLFTKDKILAAEKYITKTTNVLPKNRTEEQKAQMWIDALNATGDETVPFSLLVDAFVKKEVTKKNKPRPIANHGNARVWGMAKSAAIFEDVMFHAFPDGCVKHEEKGTKMNQIFSNLNGFKHKLENDLTAFEFGIYDRLKKAECDIFKHILGHIDSDADNTGFCHRVIDARTQACTWVLRYTDAAGAPCTLKLDLPRTMRESGDRVTSSGNFFQNLLAWLTFMVKPGKVEAAVQSLIRNKGKKFTYVSARDGRKYDAYLAFEGDDTLGGVDEDILALDNGRLCKEFFKDYGWNAKLKFADNEGYSCIQFVGYTCLLKDGQVVLHGANAVMFPEIKRVIQDKPCSSCDLPDEEFHPSVAVYATCMMNEFRYFAPMHAFYSAMRADHIAKGGRVRRSNGILRDIYIKMHGEVGTEEQILNNVPEPEPFLDGGNDYTELARVHAGDFTIEEYSCMCGITTLELHGRDLACMLPSSWRS